MLNWLTQQRFNCVDLIGYSWFVLAWHDHHRFAALVAFIGTVIVSSVLEAWPTPDTGPEQ